MFQARCGNITEMLRIAQLSFFVRRQRRTQRQRQPLHGVMTSAVVRGWLSERQHFAGAVVFRTACRWRRQGLRGVEFLSVLGTDRRQDRAVLRGPRRFALDAGRTHTPVAFVGTVKQGRKRVHGERPVSVVGRGVVELRIPLTPAVRRQIEEMPPRRNTDRQARNRPLIRERSYRPRSYERQKLQVGSPTKILRLPFGSPCP